MTYSEFKATEYRHQVVNGDFYIIKVMKTDFISPHIHNNGSFLVSEEPRYKKQEFNDVSCEQVHVGGNDYLHIYVFQSPLQADRREIKLKRVEQHKDEDPLDPIRLYH